MEPSPKFGRMTPRCTTPIVLRQRVAEARVARLATLDEDGSPHLVPVVFALAGDTLYTAVDAKPKRSRTLRRIENARARPQVTVLVDHYEEDWSRLWWVRLRGRARVLDGGEEAERALALLRAEVRAVRARAPGPAGARGGRRRVARLVGAGRLSNAHSGTDPLRGSVPSANRITPPRGRRRPRPPM